MDKLPPTDFKPSISVFFPAYNDAGSIGTLVKQALALLPRCTDDYEVLVINDGSTDGTAALLDNLAHAEPHLRVIHHPVNRGYGGALRTGFLHATKDLVFYTDGDGQYDVNELATLLPLLSDEVDVVNGYKRKRSDNQRRIVLGGAYKLLARTLFGLPIRDVDCDFRLLRRSAIQSIELVSTSGCICTEMVYKLHTAGYRFTETPVHHYARLHGQSQFFTLRRVARTASDFFALWLKLVVWQRLSLSEAKDRKQTVTEQV
ncbi:MAG: glycosyltransferase family 2 protein [Blastocatellia bacterium]|nr:glycosyltransferase family 2 protein [Blastocatellia bacterium]